MMSLLKEAIRSFFNHALQKALFFSRFKTLSVL